MTALLLLTSPPAHSKCCRGREHGRSIPFASIKQGRSDFRCWGIMRHTPACSATWIAVGGVYFGLLSISTVPYGRERRRRNDWTSFADRASLSAPFKRIGAHGSPPRGHTAAAASADGAAAQGARSGPVHKRRSAPGVKTGSSAYGFGPIRQSGQASRNAQHGPHMARPRQGVAAAIFGHISRFL
jgi:hypothetical protein